MITYKGQVVDNNDPLVVGRVRVRIPGVFDFKDINQYPWVNFKSPFQGSIDGGSFIPAEIGEWVYIEELSDNEYIWSGSWNSSQDKPLEVTSLDKRVLYKSPSGHTIFMDDTTEGEMLRLIDRSGQLLEFSCAVIKTSGKRGTGNVVDGSAKTINQLKTSSHIKLKDIAGSEFLLHSEVDNSYFHLKHADGNIIEVQSDYIEIKTKFDSTIRMAEETVTITAASGVTLTMNVSNGNITIETSGQVDVKGSQIVLNDGVGGIHSSSNYSNDYYTGTPLIGSSTEKSN